MSDLTDRLLTDEELIQVGWDQIGGNPAKRERDPSTLALMAAALATRLSEKCQALLRADKIEAAARQVEGFGDVLIGALGWIAHHTENWEVPEGERVTMPYVSEVKDAFNALAALLTPEQQEAQ